MKQDEVRKQVKLAKAKNDDIYYKHFASYIGVTEHSFYNWLKGYYKFSDEKLSKLQEVVVDLAMD